MAVVIVRYEDGHAGAFRDLNLAWIERFFQVEPHDKVVLDDPRGQILEPGGEIFMALGDDGTAAGTVAMIPSGHAFELAKMAVDPAHQGKGVGRMLMSTCLDFARGRVAEAVFLVTNSVLGPAVALYESVGFRALERIQDDRYARGNLEMRLELQTDC